MERIKADAILDAKGVACPIPIVKTKKEMKVLKPGHVLEIHATDRGSTADLKAWADSAGHHYLGTVEDGGVLMHYVRKTTDAETGKKSYPHISSNEKLEKYLASDKDIVVLDVREHAEYAFNHIPTAINIPLGEIEERLHELNKKDEIYVVCRTGNRSDLVSRKLAVSGFTNVYNVVPGMSQWTGEVESFN